MLVVISPRVLSSLSIEIGVRPLIGCVVDRSSLDDDHLRLEALVMENRGKTLQSKENLRSCRPIWANVNRDELKRLLKSEDIASQRAKLRWAEHRRSRRNFFSYSTIAWLSQDPSDQLSPLVLDAAPMKRRSAKQWRKLGDEFRVQRVFIGPIYFLNWSGSSSERFPFIHSFIHRLSSRTTNNSPRTQTSPHVSGSTCLSIIRRRRRRRNEDSKAMFRCKEICHRRVAPNPSRIAC
jgi:hypothetical protein